MFPSAFVLLALATSSGSSSELVPDVAHKFSTTPMGRSAELLSSAGSRSVRSALEMEVLTSAARRAGEESARAVVRGMAVGATRASASPDVMSVGEHAVRSGLSASSVAAVMSAGARSVMNVPVLASSTPSSTDSTVQPAPAGGLSDIGTAAARAGAGALQAAVLALNVPNPEAAELHYVRGLEALKQKDTPVAIQELSSCVKALPSRVDCRWELGWAYSVEGRWADSLTQWTEVQKLAPEHPDLETALAQARGQAALQAKLNQSPVASNRPPPPLDAKVRIRAVGDMMLGTTVPEGNLPPDGASSVIAGVRPLMEDADVTFANVEGPLCDNGSTKKCRSSRNCYAFRSPTAYGQVFKDAGVDLASTANNHSGDFGELCRRETEATLDALGIAWSGPPGSVATVDRNGLRIGMVAFHTSPSCNHLNNTETATALVRAAAVEHDIVIVSFHGGAEGGKALHVPQGREMFFGEDRGDLRLFTHAMVDAGAHVVIGHGPHVVRGMEFYKGRLIAYSLGNFATYGRFNLKGPQGLGMVLEVELDREGAFTGGRVLATKQVDKGIAVPDEKGAVIKLLRDLSTEDFPGSAARISEDGTIHPTGKGPVSARSAPVRR
ncbi:Poly-gamma-glutamate biosynthesis protein CapA/YwtB (capsule formation), metallophosphatase superfamily [Myxococcus fulvus]|uniref:Poly-gamma-glutamate biosynthesis protein CapA/YwtB (Capsule formation), metallophosphatase superfamily n=1 Tax=Myxococcus fulvus TaxID=33 RepID=A0ABY1CX91_MYXFU|nr:CapA family protein [Myxococcus fulvus]SEU39785.1 Poly-gamma-glutamate biosynthesis protein CapA/YwtB (capsule formation), metallophosphatase superfamily [Myxococcus fulvus]